MLMRCLELQELENERSNTVITDEATVKDYYNLRQQLDTHTKDMRDVIMHPNYCLPFLQAGRLVKIKFKDYDFGWGAVVGFNARRANKGEVLQPQQSYVVDVLLTVAADSKFAPHVSDGLPPGVRPPPVGEKGKVEVVPVLLHCIESIGHLRVFLPNELHSTEQKNSVRKTLDEVKKRFPDGIAILDPIENMNIKDDSFKRLLRVRSHRHTNKWYANRIRKSKSLNRDCSPTRCIILHGYQNCTANMPTKWLLPTKSRISRRTSLTPCP